MGGASPGEPPEGAVAESHGVLIEGNGSGSGMRVKVWCLVHGVEADRTGAVRRGRSAAVRDGAWLGSCLA